MREVKPAHSSVRADLIVKHEKYGWIGIEAKYFKRDGGGKAAKAHHQITRKYRGKKYAGRNKIDLWAICPYFHGRNNERNRLGYRPHQQRANMIREMFCKHGIGYIDLTRSELLIDFSFSKANSKIPVKDDEESRHYENVDADAIRENVQDKMEEYDYR